MAFVHNIRTVAHYEAKTLRRSWFFRLFSVLALFLFTKMNIGMFSPVGGESWESMAIPSALPHINIYLLNLAQAIVVIFLAADFLKRDKKLDTNEVLYTRSMSNMEYVLGKTLGILRLFIGLNILVLMIALAVNIISPWMQVDVSAFFTHLLLIAVPTIVFSLGFSFLLMSLLRNQAITFLLLLGFAALTVFYLYFRAGFIFDYLAFGLPMFKSGIVGYDNLSYILFQRLMYLSIGLASVMATIIIFKRLPQAKLQNQIARALLVVFIVTAGYSAFRVFGDFHGSSKDRKVAIAINQKYENTLFATITDSKISMEHLGEKIKASATLTVRNDHEGSLANYTFSLNPGLAVKSVADSDGTQLNFTSDAHIIMISPQNQLAPGESDQLTLTYEGNINEPYCYPYYTDDIRKRPYRIGMVNINKRQAFLTDEYVLLTPETHWYPVAALNYYPSNPARIKVDFTRYSLEVKTSSELMAVSQGTTTGSDGNYSLSYDTPLTGITLAIGHYATDTISAADIRFNVHYFPGNDYYKEVFTEIGDTLPSILNILMTDLERSFTTEYPFKSLSLIEVPVQFFSYPRTNTQTRAEVQPSLVLLPEKLVTIVQSGFQHSYKLQKKRMESQGQVITDKDLQIRMFSNFARSTFISGTNFRFTGGSVINEPSRFLLGPSFYFFKNNFFSDDFPVINSVFESHLQKVTTMQRGIMGAMGGISETDRANLILRNTSLKDILQKSPGADTLSAVLTVKGDYLFNLMRAKAGIEEFKTWFANYLNENIFTRVDIKKFDRDLNENFGFGLSEYLPGWFEGYDIPAFIFTDVKATEVAVDERSRYQVSFVVSNPEPAPGLFNISFRTGGGMAADINNIIFMEGNQAKEVNIIIDNQPRAMMVNTVMSKNLPGEMTFIISELEQAPRGTKPMEGEEILPSLPQLYESNEVIVDNEDPGFSSSKVAIQSPLKRLLGITNTDGETYGQIRPMLMPEYWQPVIQNDYFGKYVKSAVYTKGGHGERTVSWTGAIPSPGYYDVYAYIPKQGNRMTNKPMMKEFSYTVYHDDGSDEVMLDFDLAEPGWNKLGSFYLSGDSASVELSNKTTARMVLGDAVKWVKREN
ncbi:MAG: hypothetical protein RBS37_10570 [Bacteroidales bacterium]|jgi:ABC-type transport system involved in multi-copper enzyme maturation permease subunit|nr:hypothetical protein [Bacteroidales bacterium]